MENKKSPNPEDRDAISMREEHTRGQIAHVVITWKKREGDHPAMGDTADGTGTTVAIPRRVLAKAMALYMKHETKKAMERAIDAVIDETFGGEWQMMGSNDGQTWLYLGRVDWIPEGVEPYTKIENEDPTPPYQYLMYRWVEDREIGSEL